MKLLSIVIANYNYGRFLEEAIQSVVTQDCFDECELIICDAASTDNSVEIIKKYSDKLTWWCSEKDGGQSAAFNKGFEHSTGKYLTWLNADDVMVKGCLKRVVQEMKAHPSCEWFTGNLFRFVQDSGKVSEVSWGPHCYPKILQRGRSPIITYGPTTFFSRKIYEEVGRIDERLHYIMDIDLWLTFMERRVINRRINCFCWAFRLHEESKTAQYDGHGLSQKAKDQGKIEEAIVWEKHHYKVSKVLRGCVQLVRLLDGSAIRWLYYKMKYLGKPYTDIRV